MATREIIIYTRVTDTETFLVDASNNILLSQKYPVIHFTEKPTIKVRPLKADGTPYALADYSGYASWAFAIDNDWDSDTAPPISHASADTSFTVAEAVVGSTTYVQISFIANGNTSAFETDIGTTREIRSGVYAELKAYNAGITEPQLIVQFPFVLRNVLVSDVGGIPDSPTSNYPTWGQANSIYATKVKRDQTTITDDSANYIYLGDTTLYRSIQISGIIQDSSDNYNRIDGYVTHDGTNAWAIIDQDDAGGTRIGTLTFTADISNGTVRLIVTAATVGVNTTFTYGLIYIADSDYTFVPTDIAGLEEWWDANQITSLSDTDPVTSWIDATGNYTRSQSGAARPLYRTNQINGLPALDFESSSSQYMIDTLTPGTAATIFVVFKPETIGDQVLSGSTDTSSNAFIGVETATDKIAAGVATDGVSTILGTTTLSTGTVYIGTLKYNGTTVNLSLDGDVEYAAAQAAAVSNAQPIYMGARNINGSPGGYFDGLIAEEIRYNTNISSSDTDKIETYLKNKYNIS